MVVEELCTAIRKKSIGLNRRMAKYYMENAKYFTMIQDYQDQIKENEPAMVEKIGKELVEQIKAFEV